MYSIQQIKQTLNKQFEGFTTTLKVVIDEQNELYYEAIVWNNDELVVMSHRASSPKYMMDELVLKFNRESIYKPMFNNVIIDTNESEA